MVIAIPPYSDLVEFADETLNISINLGNYLFLAEDDMYIRAYFSSIQIAFNATLFCLLLGYPMAYAMARAPQHMQTTLLLLILLPSWTSFLIRIYAWMGLLKNNGLINNLLMFLGIIDGPNHHDEHKLCRLYWHCLCLPALYGASTLCQPGQA